MANSIGILASSLNAVRQRNTFLVALSVSRHICWRQLLLNCARGGLAAECAEHIPLRCSRPPGGRGATRRALTARGVIAVEFWLGVVASTALKNDIRSAPPDAAPP